MKLFVGGLPFQMEADELRNLFAGSGEVVDVHIPMDRDTGRPRGFAFVTMSSREAATAAMEALDGYQVDGRTLRVNEAQPKPEGGRGFGGGGGGGRPQGGGGRSYGDRDRPRRY